MNLNLFENKAYFFSALKTLFTDLNVPVNYIDEKPIAPKEILSKTFREYIEAYQLMDDVFVLGMVDNAAFEGKKSETIAGIEKGKKDYDGILLFGVTLKNRDKGLLPTRRQLSEITRAFNREFHYTPVVVVFKYEHFISIANAERIAYKQEWREGEKAGKVSLLRDINVKQPHTGHLKILQELTISRTGKGAVNTFAELYTYWQSVFNVSILNKKFYKELSDWYFWALKEVAFPATTYAADKTSLLKEDERVKEHNAKNLIRMLTRLLFVWFVKEKNLMPEELFDETYIRDNLINGFEPRKKKGFDYKTQGSKYYRAILQNLFFATLNQTVGKREFRKKDSHMNVTNLMRYESYFKNPNAFIKLVEDIVPFMNGGLFECLDSPDQLLKGKRGGDVIIYEDGFSDRKDNPLCVPDYIFFGTDEHADLSDELGDKKHKDVTVNGLINILNSYKFTVTENTPIEQDVALDPELLGKVFENLLASYNPETKTTARKQTGSFYTPREIVNYMVDESLKAYLKQKLETDAGMKPEDAERRLDLLIGYNETYFHDENRFDDKQKGIIINAIDNCKILDPACGSGAFPMGILHKLVHVLHKLDLDNNLWKEVQRQKAIKETEQAFQIGNKQERENRLKEISDVFEYNSGDYGRKLYLIENCIYGVDIQPIATQISKLRFFISLIVDQKADKSRDNFGIRPLPNLETKFVAANTLIGIDKPKVQCSLFDNTKVQALEEKLKNVRHRLFSAKTPATKRKLREEDQKLREEMGSLLEDAGWCNDTARQLAGWDPYNQNTSSPFFDPEWMFGITDGFDVVIGNPPYIKEDVFKGAFDGTRSQACYQGKMDLWYLFGARSLDNLKSQGVLSFIATNNWISNDGASKFRNKINNETIIYKYLDFGNYKVFIAGIQTMVFILIKNHHNSVYLTKYSKVINQEMNNDSLILMLSNAERLTNNDYIRYDYEYRRSDFVNKYITFSKSNIQNVVNKILNSDYTTLTGDEIFSGIDVMQDSVSNAHLASLNGKNNIGDGIFVLSNNEFKSNSWDKDELSIIKPYFTTKEINRYSSDKRNKYWILYTSAKINNDKGKYINIKKHLDQFQSIITSVNKPYGLHRPRVENIFLGEKILSIRKCDKPSFCYVDFPCYVARTFLIIKSSRFLLKYLSAYFNSKLVLFYLLNKGKLQGNNFQIDKEPLQLIPILKNNIHEDKFIKLYDLCSTSERLNVTHTNIESLIDAMVYELYFPDEIKAADAEVLKHLTNLPEMKDDWSDEKKMKTIEKEYQALSDPMHPVAIAMERQKTVKEVRIIEGLDK